MHKKLTLLPVALGLCYFSFGQLNYGLKVGITQSRAKESLSSCYQDMNFKSGFQAGAFLNFAFLSNLNLRPALQLTQKGYIAVEGKPQGPFYWCRNWSYTYLELPIDFVYNIPLSKTTKFYVGIGPVIGVGLFGNGKNVITASDGSGQLYAQEWTGNYPFSKPGFKRIDLGVDVLTGIQLKGFLLTATYNHGLLNALNYDQGIQTTKHRSFALNIGYFMSNH
jgi:hypothetical protein